MTDNSQEIARAERIAEQSHEIALAIKIDDPAMLEVASDELRSIVTRRKQIEEIRFSLTRPLDESKKGIIELFRTPLDRLGQSESLVRDEITRYQREEREKVEAARRVAEAKLAAERAEAERNEYAAKEALKAAQVTGDEQAAMAAQEASEEAQVQRELAEIAPPPSVATPLSALKPTGVSTRKTWKAEVIDLKALVIAAAARAQAGDEFLLGFVLPHQTAINTAAKAMQARLNIPGLRVYAEESLAVRRK